MDESKAVLREIALVAKEVAAIAANQKAIRTDITTLTHRVLGNGRAGLTERLIVVETKIDNLAERVSSFVSFRGRGTIKGIPYGWIAATVLVGVLLLIIMALVGVLDPVMSAVRSWWP